MTVTENPNARESPVGGANEVSAAGPSSEVVAPLTFIQSVRLPIPPTLQSASSVAGDTNEHAEISGKCIIHLVVVVYGQLQISN